MDAVQQFLDTQHRMLRRYDVNAQSQFIEVPSIRGRAQVLVYGEGPPVVMINGIGTPGAMWAPLMAELNGFRLIAVDLPSYGLTNTTPDFAENLRSNAVRFLIEVLNALDLEAPPFIANSLSSLLVSWLALDHPHRVSAIVHIGCPAIVLNTSAPLPMRLLSAKPIGRFLTWLQPPSQNQVEQLGKMVNEYPFTPELSDLLVATERLPGFRQTFLATLHALIRLRGSRPEMKLTIDQLARITAPTLVFWGRNDPFGSTEVGKKMVQAMPAAQLHIVEGGHAPWLTQAKHIGEIARRFLHQQIS